MDLLQTVRRSDRTKFRDGVLHPLPQMGFLALTIPGKPRSRFQKYVLTPAGARFLKTASL